MTHCLLHISVTHTWENVFNLLCLEESKIIKKNKLKGIERVLTGLVPHSLLNKREHSTVFEWVLQK